MEIYISIEFINALSEFIISVTALIIIYRQKGSTAY
ncbi:MAG: hypothetical protein K0R34_2884 [Herbinix sp.]|jgi:hypothetical protein|nr:hypothetical protein [Herbinix sp.]